VYTVNQLSKLAGVSVRTIHYYDELGLLKPESVGTNRYRHYGEKSVLKLQQILFYRELGFNLEQIKTIVGNPNFDVLQALQSHKEALHGRIERLERLIQTVDNTIQQLKGNELMDEKGIFEGFSEEEQEKYAQEAEKKYNPEIVRASNRKWKAFSKAEKERILTEGKSIYTDLAKLITKEVSDPQVQAVIALWHKHLQYFWSPNDEQLLGLADLYNDDPRFKTYYEKAAPGLAGFMREAVRLYVMRRK
jgi:DNA-binding transcriptional MerR regulator